MPRALDPRVYTNELLREALAPRSGQRVLALGVTASLVGAWAREVGPEGNVTAIERWLLDWRALLTEKQHGGAKQPLDMVFAANLDKVEGEFDVVAIDILSYTSAKALLRLTISAAERLRPGGVLYAAGAKDAGILSFGKRLGTLFGNAEPLAYRKGQRVIASHKTSALTIPDFDAATGNFSLTLRDITLDLESDPAVFAGGDLDDATEMLIAAMDVSLNDRVLDLGCGAGIIGLVAARLAKRGEVVLVDADAAAIDLSTRNVAANGITNARVTAADVVDTIAGEQFTLVVCNPPFHLRNEQSADLALRFMKGADAVLAPGGRAYFVANRFLAYESKLSAIFGNVAEVEGDERYKVLRVEKAAK